MKSEYYLFTTDKEYITMASKYCCDKAKNFSRKHKGREINYICCDIRRKALLYLTEPNIDIVFFEYKLRPELINYYESHPNDRIKDLLGYYELIKYDFRITDYLLKHYTCQGYKFKYNYSATETLTDIFYKTYNAKKELLFEYVKSDKLSFRTLFYCRDLVNIIIEYLI